MASYLHSVVLWDCLKNFKAVIREKFAPKKFSKCQIGKAKSFTAVIMF